MKTLAVLCVMALVSNYAYYQGRSDIEDERIENPNIVTRTVEVPVFPNECYEALLFAIQTGLSTDRYQRDFERMTPGCFEAVDREIEERTVPTVTLPAVDYQRSDNATQFEIEQAWIECTEDEHSEDECDELYEEYLD